jgi:hypothetical protein
MTAKKMMAQVPNSQERAARPPIDVRAEAEAASYYSETEDLTGFDGGEIVELESPPAGTRSVTLSIRLSPEELQTLAQRAEAAGIKLTTYIRGAALQAEAPPVDDDLIDTAEEVVDLIAALRASVEAAKARRDRAAINRTAS